MARLSFQKRMRERDRELRRAYREEVARRWGALEEEMPPASILEKIPPEERKGFIKGWRELRREILSAKKREELGLLPAIKWVPKEKIPPPLIEEEKPRTKKFAEEEERLRRLEEFKEEERLRTKKILVEKSMSRAIEAMKKCEYSEAIEELVEAGMESRNLEDLDLDIITREHFEELEKNWELCRKRK